MKDLLEHEIFYAPDDEDDHPHPDRTSRRRKSSNTDGLTGDDDLSINIHHLRNQEVTIDGTQNDAPSNKKKTMMIMLEDAPSHVPLDDGHKGSNSSNMTNGRIEEHMKLTPGQQEDPATQMVLKMGLTSDLEESRGSSGLNSNIITSSRRKQGDDHRTNSLNSDAEVMMDGLQSIKTSSSSSSSSGPLEPMKPSYSTSSSITISNSQQQHPSNQNSKGSFSAPRTILSMEDREEQQDPSMPPPSELSSSSIMREKETKSAIQNHMQSSQVTSSVVRAPYTLNHGHDSSGRQQQQSSNSNHQKLKYVTETLSSLPASPGTQSGSGKSASPANRKSSPPVGRNGNRSWLYFTPKSKSDFGVFQCWATNIMGKQAEPCTFKLEPAGMS